MGGAGHPCTMKTVSRLACLLDARGKHSKAKEVRKGRRMDTNAGTGTPSASNEDPRPHPAIMCANCRSVEPASGAIQFRLCSQCKVARYCSRECQKAHWKSQHKHQCLPIT